MRKKIITILVLLAIVAALAYYVPLPWFVNKTLDGIKWTDGEPGYSEPAQITVKGVYLMYLFKDNTFEGNITFTGLDPEVYSYVFQYRPNKFYKFNNNEGMLYYS